MPKSEKIEKIITKYLSKSTTKKDLDKLLDALKSESTKELFKSYIKTNYLVDYHMKDFQTEEEKEKLFKLLNSNTKILKKKKQFQFLKYAALFAVLVSLASYYWISKKNFKIADDVIVSQEQSVLPGSSKAILTLEDGSDIVLHKDSVYTNTNSSAVKNKLIYSKKTSEELAQVKYNFLTVPRGGQYYVKLADGTAVWINSDSQLKYPTSFKSGETRKVELVYGEAYFDVSPSAEHNGSRFKVLSKYQEVEVLGTEFNIKAYNDESYVYTTLVEGKVSLTANAKQDILKPNEQVTFNVDNKEYAKNIVDVYDVTSWKNGVFSFKRKPLKEITKVLSRWYNVDFKFTNKEIEDVKFMGVVSKDSPLEDILLSIKNSGFIKSYQINKTSVTLN
ncbi:MULTISPECIES: FecR family protein [unclassified Cellulophaga]|uniref:FecR family protein n=1 Tax=unclassified Cellulophaga TaxID=2634405 RepID=UPI0026E33DF2|nr:MULTISPECIES: FecR family protein [unclassified Cellulophaga]MDO6491979.1 FecR domain-containing protein [Cellulophaga sp. 2_MG-2023]MDO6495861.1 FecR domain-containing protein [Cellulophaga sp. 3_MG-2023]